MGEPIDVDSAIFVWTEWSKYKHRTEVLLLVWQYVTWF